MIQLTNLKIPLLIQIKPNDLIRDIYIIIKNFQFKKKDKLLSQQKNKMQKQKITKIPRIKGKALSTQAKLQQLDINQPSTPIPIISHQKIGQNVKVAIRIRPMNQIQISRGDINCLNVVGEKTLQINHKDVHKSYDFNCVLDANSSQQKVYTRLNISELINAAVQGYSTTIFAYGQTGSGKTYTMSGKQQQYITQQYRNNQAQAIIQRSIQQLWHRIKQTKIKYVIKASYTQIYNQQIKDLLNLSSGILHCRWNPSNGFFVQDLIIVDCTNIDDMISVLNQGIKNRTSGSHQLNKDSSRSHSIMTFYIISQLQSNNGQIIKKYGKIAFVDLAGSQRLKQSKSQGDMIKQTGNINKSLFTLGKVIKGLTDKKCKTPYIPYRDSKLTMLLMDSLGGNSKSLMIACVSPSQNYFDQTLSTLNYAARTMNIRNKPIIQMDQKDQIIYQIQQEIQQLKKQNGYLRQQYQRINKGLPIKIPELGLGKNDLVKTAIRVEGSHGTQLPPLQKGKGEQNMTSRKALKNDSTQQIISEYQKKFELLKKQNQSMRNQRDHSQQQYKKLMQTNNLIQNKLDNLQQIFLIKKKQHQFIKDQIITSNLLVQNTQLKKKLKDVQKQKIQLEFYQQTKIIYNLQEIQNQNLHLQSTIELLQNRQKQLLAQLQRKK